MPTPPKRRKLPARALIFLPQLNSWCTGKDSNLRTSQGGADLQSAGFNHSPTCAERRAPAISRRPAKNYLAHTAQSQPANSFAKIAVGRRAQKFSSTQSPHSESLPTECRWTKRYTAAQNTL